MTSGIWRERLPMVRISAVSRLSFMPVTLFRVAALLAWLALGVPLVLALMTPRQPAGGLWLSVPALVAWLVFLVASRGFRPEPTPTHGRSIVCLLIQTAAALAIAWLAGWFGTNVALFIVIVAQAATILPTSVVLLWIGGQTTAALAPWLLRNPLPAATAAAAYVGFQIFAVGAVRLAESERRARRQLAQVNATLKAMQSLLDETNRLGERLRISRELHDTMGHDLTALALNLEAAGHLVNGQAATHVATARSIAKRLLGEVRSVVGAIRGPSGMDFAPALAALIERVPEPRIHLLLPDNVDSLTSDPERAHVVFRCVQEIITNAVRHSAARNLHIEIRSDADGLRVTAQDDGRGTANIRPGSGLTGMRDRVERAGGRLELASQPGAGFRLSAILPSPGRPS